MLRREIHQLVEMNQALHDVIKARDAEIKELREALADLTAVAGAKPWMDGGVSWGKWYAAIAAAENLLK